MIEIKTVRLKESWSHASEREKSLFRSPKTSSSGKWKTFPPRALRIDAHGGLRSKRGASAHTLRALNSVHRCAVRRLSSSGSFGLLSESALSLLSADLFTSLHCRASFQHSHPETCTALSGNNRSALSALWASPGCEQTAQRKDISHLPVPKPLSFTHSQHIVYASNFCRNNASKPGTTVSAFSKILV